MGTCSGCLVMQNCSRAALKHLGEQDTWKLQILVQLKPEVDYRRPIQPNSSWWNWNRFHMHVATRAPKGLFNSLWNTEYDSLFNSLWNTEYDSLRFGVLSSLQQHKLRLAKEAASGKQIKAKAKSKPRWNHRLTLPCNYILLYIICSLFLCYVTVQAY